MHLNDEQIQRLMHGELDADSRAAVSRHVAECSDCARALADARREEAAIFDLLGAVDHDAPVVDAATVAGSERGRGAVWGRRAAVIVFVAALGGAAYAIPGSPLPRLVRQLAAVMTGQRAESPAPGDVSTPASPVTSGIAVPAGDPLLISFSAAQDSGGAVVWLTDDSMARVRVIGGKATFTTDAGTLAIANAGSRADYEIELPRGVSRARIRVASWVRFEKDGDRVMTDARADSLGRYRLLLAPPR
jgi:hypothetical protein